MSDVEKLQILYDKIEDSAIFTKADLQTVFRQYSSFLNSFRSKSEKNAENTKGLKSHSDDELRLWVINATNKNEDLDMSRAKSDLGNGIKDLIDLLLKEA